MSIEQYIEKEHIFDGAPYDIKKPSVFRKAQIALKGIDEVISELNKICKIEFSGGLVGFTPRIDLQKFGGRGNKNVYLETRQHVNTLLQKIGFVVKFDTQEDNSNWPNSSCYIDLKDVKNLKLMQRLGSKFSFYYKRPLQQQDIETLKTKSIQH